MKTNLVHAVPRYFLAFALAFSLCLPTAGLAYAIPDEESTPPENTEETQTQSTAPDDSSLSPCIPSEEDIAKWEADGTLDERIAFQESLGNGEVSSDLIAQALQRNSGPAKLRSSNGNNLPDGDVKSEEQAARRSMPTYGTARVLALHIDFDEKTYRDEETGYSWTEPAMRFEEGDSLDALQSLIGADLPSEQEPASIAEEDDPPYKPYNSLHDYYYRSSYTNLKITGTAVHHTAHKPRFEYESAEELFVEALTELNEEIDYAQYDGNDDGYIDAVYLRFAGKDSGWGTTWWSNCNIYHGDQPELNGKMKIGRIITLHLPSNTDDGVRTAIHETGHALGLPDYYTYNEMLIDKDPSERTGILTFDMMNANIGDHNAYSKWLLGWIPDNKITRVVADENGITVKTGTQEEVVTEADKNGESAVEAALGLLATDSASECGGFIAISNDKKLLDQNGLFSSFYLLEYNGYKGNQIVSYRSGYEHGNDLSSPIPYGFRLFRIQGDLKDNGLDFIHQNKTDDVHNQFIELVDHDGSCWHFGFDGLVDGTGEDPYGCMMVAGDSITPEGVFNSADGSLASYPSTNFFENINRGFTGLSIEVLTSGSTGGKVQISYSDTAKPELTPSTLTLAQTNPRAVSNIDAFTLTGSIPLFRNQGVGTPLIRAKNTYGTVYVEDIDGSSLDLYYEMQPELFTPGESCEIIFPENYFLIGNLDGNAIYSEEIRISLTIEDAVHEDKSGDYVNAVTDKRIVSNVITTDQGTTYFAVSNKDKVELCKVDPNDPTIVSKSEIELENGSKTYRLILEPLPDGKICIVTSASLDYSIKNVAHWVNPDTHTVEAKAWILEGNLAFLHGYEDSLIAAYTYPIGNEAPLHTLAVYTPGNNEYAEEKFWDITDIGGIYEVSNTYGEIAFTGYRYSEFSHLAKIVDAADIINWPADFKPVAFSSIQAKTQLDISDFDSAAAFAYNNGTYLGVTLNEPEGAGSPDINNQANLPTAENVSSPAWHDSYNFKSYIVSFGETGSIDRSNELCSFPDKTSSFKSLSVSPDGIPVVEILLKNSNYEEGRRMFFFRNGITNDPITLTNDTNASGTWLHNDAWIEIGLNFPYSRFFSEDNPSGNDGALGSPDLSGEGIGDEYPGDGEGIGGGEGDGLIGDGYEEESRPVHYLLAFLPTDENNGGNDGGEGPDPIPGSGNNNGNESTLSNTGDATGLIMGACAIAAIAAIAVAVIAFRASRKQRNR